VGSPFELVSGLPEAKGHTSTEMPMHSIALVIDLMMPRFFVLAFMV
jgi:hypothetical protein